MIFKHSDADDIVITLPVSTTGRVCCRPFNISKLRTRVSFVNIESYPWLRSSKLCERSSRTLLCCREDVLDRKMAAIEAEGFTIKAGMKNSKV